MKTNKKLSLLIYAGYDSGETAETEHNLLTRFFFTAILLPS